LNVVHTQRPPTWVKLPGGDVREHFRQRALVGVGLGPVIERAVEARAGGPGVLGRGVVEHDVDAQRHPARAQLVRELTQVVDRPERGLDPAVIEHGVAAVVRRRSGVQERHQVQVGDAELAQVRQPLAHAGERPREPIDVRHVADGLLALEPVGRDLAFVVELAQFAWALGRSPLDGVQQRSPGT
jgi:hypothetical protein